jgi:hypothetical protein
MKNNSNEQFSNPEQFFKKKHPNEHNNLVIIKKERIETPSWDDDKRTSLT